MQSKGTKKSPSGRSDIWGAITLKPPEFIKAMTPASQAVDTKYKSL